MHFENMKNKSHLSKIISDIFTQIQTTLLGSRTCDGFQSIWYMVILAFQKLMFAYSATLGRGLTTECNRQQFSLSLKSAFPTAQAITSKTASQPWGEGVSPVFVQGLLSPEVLLLSSPDNNECPKKTLQGHLL